MNTFSIQPDSIRFDDRGLVPAIVRDASSGRLLMLAWMNRESLERTLENGETWFWSRQRQGLWHKGETSGNRQKVLAIREDCDGDALLIDVAPLGPACHTGSVSCFHDEPSVLEALYSRIVSRRGADPANSYTASLFAAGKNRILKKIGEEAIEVIVAAGNETRERVVSETADLLYHLLVMLAAEGITLEEVWAELTRRARPQ